MNTVKLFVVVLAGMFLVACGGGGSAVNAPSAPTGVTATLGNTTNTVMVSFTGPADSGGSPITGYTVTSNANPSVITAAGATSPITVPCTTPCTGYAFSVIAANAAGNSASSAQAHVISTYNITETFHEPMTQPNDSIFTGSFTFDSTTGTVSNLTGSLTQAMTKPVGCTGMGCYGSIPMTTVSLTHQLSAVSDATLGGLLVTTFALNTNDTFNGGGFAPGGTQYFGLSAGTPNSNSS
jgi:hypothetical protein